jgi:hypothetical protein
LDSANFLAKKSEKKIFLTKKTSFGMDASLFLGSISGFCAGLGRYSLSLKIVVPLRFSVF